MTRTTYFVASTLDGFIADPQDSLGWLLTRDVDRDGPMGYGPFIAGVGAIAMGASTYRWLRQHEQAWPYDVPTWVFSHGELDAYEGADVRFTSADVAEVHAEMVAAAGDRDAWLVGGGDLVGQFTDRGLLDELLVSVAPVTLGAGVPLLPRHVELRLLDVARNRDVACMRYEVLR